MKSNYPPMPTNSQDIWNYPGDGEYLACAIARHCTTFQRLAYRKLRKECGEQRFREILCEALDILQRSRTIEEPPRWLYWFIADSIV